MSDFSEASYWDKVSVRAMETSDNGGDTIRELLRDAFETVTEPSLRELFSIEADVIYLNLVCEYPQSGVGKMCGMSQMGVSKRVDRGMRKLKIVLTKPTGDMEEAKRDLRNMVSLDYYEYLLLYYKFPTYAYVSQIVLEESKTKIPRLVNSGIYDLEKFIGGDLEHIKDDDKVDYLTALEDPTFYASEIDKATEYLRYFKTLITTFSYGDVQFKARVKKLHRHHMLDCV